MALPKIIVTRKAGFELEVATNGRPMAESLRAAPEVPTGDRGSGRYGGVLCDYSCGCGALVHPKSDCTASAEFAVGGVSGTAANAPEMTAAMEMLQTHAVRNRVQTSDGVGGHVHVDRTDLTYEQARRVITNFIVMQDQFAPLMAMASKNGVRRNGCMSHRVELSQFSYMNEPDYRPRNGYGDRSAWLYLSGKGTFEFRGWNASVAAWRLAMAVAVSSAFVQASADGKEATEGMTMAEFLSGYLSIDMERHMERQQAYMRGEKWIAPPESDEEAARMNEHWTEERMAAAIAALETEEIAA